MGLWVSFAFGALLGVFLGVLIGRARAAARGQGARAPSEGHAPTATPMTPPRSLPPEIQHVVLDEGSANRSEEHTSELQSRLHLVCRLLLEKKKKNKKNDPTEPLVPTSPPPH